MRIAGFDMEVLQLLCTVLQISPPRVLPGVERGRRDVSPTTAGIFGLYLKVKSAARPVLGDDFLIDTKLVVADRMPLEIYHDHRLRLLAECVGQHPVLDVLRFPGGATNPCLQATFGQGIVERCNQPPTGFVKRRKFWPEPPKDWITGILSNKNLIQ